MASSSKPSSGSVARRKSSTLTKGSLMVTLKLSPKALQTLQPEPAAPVKEESPSKDSSSTISIPLPVAPSSSGHNPSESSTNTPAAAGTPIPISSMPPPTEGVKKRGVKRAAGPALGPDGLPKPRGKPGPKKKPRLEDGSVDHSATVPRAANAAAHKLGPKANQGAINAGLRALDRTGKPCRKWQKGSFKLKSFTGVVWEIPRWTAPPRVRLDGTSADSASGDSSKENKDNSQMDSEKSEKSNAGADVEIGSSAGNDLSSPAPSAHPDATPTATPTATPVVTASA